MSLPGLGLRPFSPCPGPSVEWVQSDVPLRRTLAFAGRSIDDVVNCPVARREVAGYFKLARIMVRRGEVLELQAQWDPLGRLR